MNPFDYVNSISYNKKNLMRDTDNDDLAEKEYASFLSNKALSYYTDTILYANEMNILFFLDNKMQYEYLLYSVRPGKRFSKWSKKENTKDVPLVAKYFNVSNLKAEEYIKILPKNTIKEIVSKTENL